MGALLLLGVAKGKRVRLQQAARASLGLPAAQVLDWGDWLAQPQRLPDLLQQASPALLKIDSPGEDSAVQQHLLSLGAQLLHKPVPAPVAHGQLMAHDCWFAGFAECLKQVQAQTAAHPVALCNAVPDILLMTDKLACQQHLQAQGLPVPPLLGQIESGDALLAQMRAQSCSQVFVKIRYGSSACGVLALRSAGGKLAASSSADWQHSGAGPMLFNSKRIRHYRDARQIMQIVDWLCAQQAYAEVWLPKPSAPGGHFDLRVLCLQGQARHVVARLSRQAMTNLHLDSQRRSAAEVLAAPHEQALRCFAGRAAQAFPHSRVIGFDIIQRGVRSCLLEANAFGDLLPGLLHAGHDPYQDQALHWEAAA
ncbi:STM4014 family protein [Massilia sp. W12]|uniref:STM4014 family protein n=1 Tax=Massilia sp. W12 TaxID=3126507 RepID=UPI0030D562A0